MSPSKSYVGPLSPEYALLGLLAQQPAHGYYLHQELARRLGQIWHINQSQTYSILNRLEQRGWVRGRLQEQEGRPDRRLLELTPTGRAQFERWLQAPPGSSVRAIRVEFLTRLYFTRLFKPAQVETLLRRQMVEVEAGLVRLQASRAAIPQEEAFNRLGLELRLNQLGRSGIG